MKKMVRTIAPNLVIFTIAPIIAVGLILFLQSISKPWDLITAIILLIMIFIGMCVGDYYWGE